MNTNRTLNADIRIRILLLFYCYVEYNIFCQLAIMNTKHMLAN